VKKFILAAIALLAASSAGCMKAYDKPEFTEIDTSETAFLVPLEGDAGKQAQTQTADFLAEKKVHAKRVQITHRWNQTGRWETEGEWIPSVRLIKVDRRPVTRQWTASKTSGTSLSDEALKVESKDSVGFSIGVECTARIIEDKAHIFLYYYPCKKAPPTDPKDKGTAPSTVTTVEQMMDTELRTKIHEIVARECGKYDLDEVRAKKNEIMQTVKAEVTPFFEGRGVEITAITITGGLTFDNQAIQKAIDDAAQQSQLKVAEQMKLDAQAVTNKRLLSEAEGKAVARKREAEGTAAAAIAEANGEAQARITRADAEAKSIKSVAEAREYELQRIKADPVTYLSLKRFEVELKKLERWSGNVPQYLIESGGQGTQGSFMIIPPSMPKDKEQPPAFVPPPVLEKK
jgi:regulator of protease activity HflC (stomatin/prohibitin superfamily)